MRTKHHCFLVTVAAFLLNACGPETNDAPDLDNSPQPVATTRIIDYKVVKRHLHDPNAFIEGFMFYGDKLLESTGSPENMTQTRSVIGELDLEKGKLEAKAEIKDHQFGER